MGMNDGQFEVYHALIIFIDELIFPRRSRRSCPGFFTLLWLWIWYAPGKLYRSHGIRKASAISDRCQLPPFTIALHLRTDKYHRLQKHIFQSRSCCCPGTDGSSPQGPIPGPHNIYNGKPSVYPAVPFL